MRRRDGEHARDLGQHAVPVAATRGRIACGAEYEVRASFGQRIPCSAEHFAPDPQLRVRGALGFAMRVERGDERKHARERDRRVDGDPQLRLPSGRDAPDALLGVPGRREQFAAGVEQRAAGGRELRAMPAPVEQQHVEVVLEPAHRVRDRGRHAVEFHRRRGEAAATVDRVQHRERIEGERHMQII